MSDRARGPSATRRMLSGLAVGALLMLGSACDTTEPPAHIVVAPPTMTTVPTVTVPACVYRDGRADHRCTPGAVNPAVTQANIHSTICKANWTDTVRPPVSFTNQYKSLQMARYGFPPVMGNYKEDHLISLELGGAPRDPQNMYPQTNADSYRKDKDERALRTQVCAGTMTLAAAQAQIVQMWTSDS